MVRGGAPRGRGEDSIFENTTHLQFHTSAHGTKRLLLRGWGVKGRAIGPWVHLERVFGVQDPGSTDPASFSWGAGPAHPPGPASDGGWDSQWMRGGSRDVTSRHVTSSHVKHASAGLTVATQRFFTKAQRDKHDAK